MLTPINNINQKVVLTKVQNIKTRPYNINTVSQNDNDTFEKNNISFTGRNLVGLKRDFKTSMIAEVKRNMPKQVETWTEKLYATKYQYLKDNRPSHRLSVRGQTGYYNTNNPIDRFFMGFLSIGGTEVERACENARFRKEAKNYIDNLIIIRSELEHIQFNENLAEVNKNTTKNSDSIVFETSIQDVKTNEIRPKFLDKIQRFREGRPTEMPNCVMISNHNKEINNNLINWIKEHSNANIEEFSISEEPISKLEQLEEKYQKTGDWNILFAPNWDSLIDQNANQSSIAIYKDIMSNCAEDYHTTILFSAQKPENLDSIALQPHRVTRINTSDVKSKDELELISATKRLQEKDYIEKTPIAALNDLLYISGNNQPNFKWDYTKEEFEEAKNILDHFSNKNPNYKDSISSILNSLCDLW